MNKIFITVHVDSDKHGYKNYKMIVSIDQITYISKLNNECGLLCLNRELFKLKDKYSDLAYKIGNLCKLY